jgi:hypothetical protein
MKEPGDVTDKRRETMFGPGEYVFPSHQDSEVFHAQLVYLDAVQRLAPEVIASLVGDAYPIFRRVLKTWPPDHGEERLLGPLELSATPGWSAVLSATPTYLPELIPLREALRRWARRFNIREDWFFRAALDVLSRAGSSMADTSKLTWHKFEVHEGGKAGVTVSNYRDVTGVPYGLHWVTTIPTDFDHPPIEAEEQAFVFENDGWDVLNSSWQAASTKIKEEFQQALGTYEARMRSLADRRGLRRAMPKRAVDEHMEWLVRFQLLKQTPGAIAVVVQKARVAGQKRRVTEDAVSRAIAAMADLVQLELRI